MTLLNVISDKVNNPAGVLTYQWSDPNPVSLNFTTVQQPEASPLVTSTYNVTITDITKWNNMRRRDRIFAGRKIKIYKKKN